MFNINQNEGFSIKFDNGWTASVQWGPGNYCENRTDGFHEYNEKGVPPSKNAEIAAWDKDGNSYMFGPNHEVKGWCSPKEVANFLVTVSELPINFNETRHEWPEDDYYDYSED